MSETIKRFISYLRSHFSPSEKMDPLQRMPDVEPDESERSEELNLAEAVGYEISREIET